MKRHASDSWLKSSRTSRRSVCEPRGREDLVINRNRVKDVSDWLDRAVSSPTVSLLLLCGPAGSGKTACVRVLANEKGIQILEWTTPVDNYESWEDSEWTKPVTVVSKFRHFLLGAGRYSPVVFDKFASSSSSNKKLIIVKDFPTSFLSSPEEFTGIVDFYVAHGRAPVVFICTESTKKKSKDIAFELFSEELKQRHNILQLSFLPVPVTSIVKALKRVTQLSCISVNDELLQELAQESHGDIRKAINDLNIFSVDTSKLRGYRTVNKRGKSGQADKKKTIVKDADKETTGLFHSVGRVLYAKRDTPNEESACNKLCGDPRGELVHKPLEIARDFSHYSRQFISLAHSNYLDIFSSIDCIAKAAEYLSDSDLIMSEWREKELLSTVGFTVAVGGLMESNDNPIRRWKPLRGSQWNDDLKTAKANYVCVESVFSKYSLSKCDVILEIVPFVTQIWRTKNSKTGNVVKWCPHGFLPHRVEDLLPVIREIQSNVLDCPALISEAVKDNEESDPDIHISDDSD